MSILFILSSSFILIPWICNICFLFIFRYQHSINNNFETNKWFRDHSYKLVLVTMLCGSANTAINLMNSQIFGLGLFNMGLTKLQLIETNKFKVILNIALENVPQIGFTVYYVFWLEGVTDFAVMSLISSTLSVILIVVVTIIFSIDPLNDEYLEMTLKYNEPIESGGDSKFGDLETNLLKKFGFHKRIAQSIAYSFGLTKNLVNVDRHKYNVKQKTVTLLISINNVNAKKSSSDAGEGGDETDQKVSLQDEEAISRATNVNRTSITDNIINKIDRKHATLMVIKILEIMRCPEFSNLFYQINLIPLNQNGNKRLPVSKKIKLDHNLMTDFTSFNDSNEQFGSSLLRDGSTPYDANLSNEMIDINGDDDDNDQDEMMNIPAAARPISIDADGNQIEMVVKKPANDRMDSTAL